MIKVPGSENARKLASASTAQNIRKGVPNTFDNWIVMTIDTVQGQIQNKSDTVMTLQFWYNRDASNDRVTLRLGRLGDFSKVLIAKACVNGIVDIVADFSIIVVNTTNAESSHAILGRLRKIPKLILLSNCFARLDCPAL